MSFSTVGVAKRNQKTRRIVEKNKSVLRSTWKELDQASKLCPASLEYFLGVLKVKFELRDERILFSNRIDPDSNEFDNRSIGAAAKR